VIVKLLYEFYDTIIKEAMQMLLRSKISKAFKSAVAFLLVIALLFSPVARKTADAIAWVPVIFQGVMLGVSFGMTYNSWQECAAEPEARICGAAIINTVFLAATAGSLSASTTFSYRGKPGVLTVNRPTIKTSVHSQETAVKFAATGAAQMTRNGLYATARTVGKTGRHGGEWHHLLPEKLARFLGAKGDDFITVFLESNYHRTLTDIAEGSARRGIQAALGGTGADWARKGVDQGMTEIIRGLRTMYKGNPKALSISLYDLFRTPTAQQWLMSKNRAAGLTLLTSMGLTTVFNSSSPAIGLINDGFGGTLFRMEGSADAVLRGGFGFNGETFISQLESIVGAGNLRELSVNATTSNIIADANNGNLEVSDEYYNALVSAINQGLILGTAAPNTTPPAPNNTPNPAVITDITNQFAGRTVRIRSVEANNQYLNAPNSGRVHANSGTGGQYTVVLHSDNWLSFRTGSNRFISVQGGDYLTIEEMAHPRGWECFRIFSFQGNHYLLAQKNESFVQVRTAEAGALQAARQRAHGLDGAAWERFQVEIVGGSPAPSIPAAPPGTPQAEHVTNRHYRFENSAWVVGTYTGGWRNNRPEGRGTLVYASDSRNRIDGGYHSYDGDWVNGRPVGYGKVDFDSGSNNARDGWLYFHGNFHGMYGDRIGQVVRDVYWHHRDGRILRNVQIPRDAVSLERQTFDRVDSCPHCPAPVPTPAPAQIQTPTPTPAPVTWPDAPSNPGTHWDTNTEWAKPGLTPGPAPFDPGAFKYSMASSWAAESVTAMYDRGIIPESMTYHYGGAATRLDFLRLAYKSLESKIDIGYFVGRGGSFVFTDIEDAGSDRVYAGVLHHLGIISGVGKNRFDPHREITRQEAAVMLSRIHCLLRYGSVTDYLYAGSLDNRYADDGRIAEWAKSGVYNMRAVGVMNGVGNNRFDPRGSYTNEQAIFTLKRLIEQ
jgi:hypothetical protein